MDFERITPKIKIIEIVLEYQYSKKEINEIRNVINDLTTKYLCINLNMRQTKLKQFFD